jgi:hypothetical protein
VLAVEGESVGIGSKNFEEFIGGSGAFGILVSCVFFRFRKIALPGGDESVEDDGLGQGVIAGQGQVVDSVGQTADMAQVSHHGGDEDQGSDDGDSGQGQ